MMIKNNIGSILLVLGAFFGAFFVFASINAENERREALNVLKYQESLIEQKSANLEQVQILSGSEIGSSNVLINGDVLEGSTEGESLILNEDLLIVGIAKNDTGEGTEGFEDSDIETLGVAPLFLDEGEEALRLEELLETEENENVGVEIENLTEGTEKDEGFEDSDAQIAEDNVVTLDEGEEMLRLKELLEQEENIDFGTEIIDPSAGTENNEGIENEGKNIVQENLLGVYNPEVSFGSNIELVAEKKTFPASLNTSMNFHSQSPFGTWGEIFGETCEEASILLAYLYFEGITVTAQEFRDELLRLVDYQNEVFGDYKHTNVVQTAKMLRDYYKYNDYYILENPTADDLKYNIAKGSIILAPFYGVGMNPYYTGIGPEYHFMILKGYTENTFITHDVGTRRGENYEYPIDTIMERIHDYNEESVQLGAKRVIVVSPR